MHDHTCTTASSREIRSPGALDQGRPLERRTRTALEPRFGFDLGHVRVHTDAGAATTALVRGAEAYTTGPDIVFAPGRYAPGTRAGDSLIAHELTHVAQQQGTTRALTPPGVAPVDSPGEREARSNAAAVLSTGPGAGSPLPVRTRATAPVLQCQEMSPEDQRAGTITAFRNAVRGRDWGTAARLLAEMSTGQRQTELGLLPSDTRAVLRTASAALDPGPDNPVTRQIEAIEHGGGAEPAERISPAPERLDVARMSSVDKLLRAWEYAKPRIGDDVREQLAGLVTPQSLAAMAFFVALYIGSQVTPVGWVADALALAGLTVSAVFAGRVVFDVATDVTRFFLAIKATDEAGLRTAGEALSHAIAVGGVALVMELLTRSVRGTGGAGRSGGGAPPTGYAPAVTPEGVRIWVPVAAAEQAVAASRLQRAAATYMVAAPPPRGPSSSGARESTPAAGGTRPQRGPEVFDELSEELGLEAERQQAGTGNAVQDAQQAGFVGEEGAPGTVDAAFQQHGDASAVRSEYGVSGKEVESAHIGPTSFLKKVGGYSRRAAETLLLRRKVHGAFDRYWKDWARDQRRAGRTEVTVASLYEVMLKAIDQIPELEQRTKNALAWRLELELFRDLGLQPQDTVPLPYPNVKPTGPAAP
ncbi:eCIS core domain-containing protein [Streptomyces herbicida]|uniref:eCIS core domain-containing protein n=1 Tax=Streptomyces herbicida TaxID=3065675 RepID=UPI00292D41DC|nr:DUF4157 domain-containing protein [Streptomyces sp. NEAU-HV9]